MPGQITEQLTHSAYATSGTPLSASYSQVGSVLVQIGPLSLAAATSLQSIAASWGPAGVSSGDLEVVFLLASMACTLQTNGNGTPGIQTLTVGGTPTGGTFALAYQGQITAPIAYNAAASAVQSALQALSTIGGGNAICTGGPLPGTAVTVTFGSALTTATVPLLTANIAGLTGGTPTIAIANTSGTPQDVIQLAANVPLAWDISSGLECPFLGAVSTLYVSCSSAGLLKGSVLTY